MSNVKNNPSIPANKQSCIVGKTPPNRLDMNKLIEYIDLLFTINEIDINFNMWSHFSESDKISFIRDIKIKKLL